MGVQLLDERQIFLLSWKFAFVLPAGAFFVGMVASAGFIAGMRLSGRKPGAVIVWSTVASLAVAYFVAEYLEYRRLNPDALAHPSFTFWRYFDASTRALYIPTVRGGDGLGLFGYVFRVIDLAGFVAGGAAGFIGSTFNRDYCAVCRGARRERWLALLEDDGERAAFSAACRDWLKLPAWLASRQRPTRKTLQKLEGDRFLARLVFCPDCHAGMLEIEELSGAMRGMTIEKHALDRHAVRQLSASG